MEIRKRKERGNEKKAGKMSTFWKLESRQMNNN